MSGKCGGGTCRTRRHNAFIAIHKFNKFLQISKARLKVPVRSDKCRHVECFDLRSYLDYHRQLTFWECPFSFCKALARCVSLRVDEYVARHTGL